jgi:hypothetical protein
MSASIDSTDNLLIDNQTRSFTHNKNSLSNSTGGISSIKQEPAKRKMRKNSGCRRSMTVLAGAGGGFINKE